MSLAFRMYHHEHDFIDVMQFLRDTFTETKSLHNWLPPRFENSGHNMATDTCIWEKVDNQTGNTRIVGMATPETKNRFFIQLHQDYEYLLEEILQWIIDHTKSKNQDQEEVKLSIVILEGNKKREAVLVKLGFKMGEVYGILRLRDVKVPIPEYSLPDGFTVRSVEPETDFERIASCIRIVFGHGEWFNREVLMGLSRASFYHKDLDLVAVDVNDDIVSFCTFRLDEPSGIVELEPMGTLPCYRRRGIGKALLCEGFRRLRRYRPTLLYIGGAANTPAANKLYEATGFTEKHDYYFWHKTLEPILG